MSEGLTITKGGKLIKTSWSSKSRKFIKKDITKFAFRYLYEPCTLEKGLKLRDIFLLLKKNITVFDLIIGNWCKEIVLEGLKPYKNKEKEIDYLEVYWDVRTDKEYKTEKPILTGTNFPSFHGMGKARKTIPGHKKGEWIPYGVSFSPANELANIPLRLAPEIKIYDDDDWKKDPINLGRPEFSLGHILYSIIWELSFHGGPSSRKKKKEELLRIVENIKKK